MEKPPSVLVLPFIISLEPRAVLHRLENSQRAGRSSGWRTREEGGGGEAAPAPSQPNRCGDAVAVYKYVKLGVFLVCVFWVFFL